MYRIFYLPLGILLSNPVFCQQKQSYKIAVAAFYNCENFYDTINNPLSNDDEFTPAGEKNYNSVIYSDKVSKLATVIAQIGTDQNPATTDGPALLGVAEIENAHVLNDLVHHPLLSKRGYRFVHYEGKDSRGIEVALIYNPKYFTVEDSRPLFVKLPGYYYTRDILWVTGKLDGETIHIYVNHWPSRLGGEARSAPSRAAAAMVCKKHMDSILKADGEQKVLIMGDFNDDPVSAGISRILRAKEKIQDVSRYGLYNPWTELYKKGIGTLAYQDSWGLFDQILLSRPWIKKDQPGFFFYQQHVFNREFMTENTGRYRGYPMRTWDGNIYRGGYSDHFPVYLVLLKKKETRLPAEASPL